MLWTFRWKKQIFLTNALHTQQEIHYFSCLLSCAKAFVSFLQNEQAHDVRLDTKSQLLLSQLQQGGVIYVSAHFGKYEQMGSWMQQQSIPLTSSYLPLKNSFWNQCLEKLRQRGGHTNIHQNTLHDFHNILKQKQTLGIMIDQASPTGKSTTFFGKPCLNNKLPEILARKHQCPIILGLWKSNKQTTFDLYQIKSNSPLQEINDLLEKEITQHPNLWFGWFHRRFKLGKHGKKTSIYTD